MYTKSIVVVAIVGLGAMLVASNPYAPTYNDGYEQPQAHYQPHQPAAYQAPAYQAPAYQAPAYQAPAYQAPAYSAPAPAYPKYNAPSSAHHTQYDNYYPKQTYSKPMYAPAKPMYAPPQAYHQPQPYAAPKPAYQAPSYGGDEYKSRA